MKQRITYFVQQGTTLDLKDIQVEPDGINYSALQPPFIEKRVTARLSELPEELRDIIDQIHELHIRWSSRLKYDPISPLVSRLPPGLHVFFTPRQQERSVNICPLLKQAFGDLKCDTVLDSFSSPSILSGRFSSTSTYQYYSLLPKLLHFQLFLARTICNETTESCVNEVASLLYASYIDIDYDALSHAVTFTAFWRAGIQPGSAITAPKVWKAGDSLEVGILHNEESDEPEELKLGGYLTEVGEQAKPSGTLFSFPSRHHPLPSSNGARYVMDFQQPAGLHPKIVISFPKCGELFQPKEGYCALHAYLTLPSSLFIDRYQLSDSLFLASQKLIALRSLSGEQDLEAPDWAITRWGSAALLELAHPDQATLDDNSDTWNVTIPTHLRYLKWKSNSTDSSETSIDIPYPVVFWACEADEGLKMSTSPFDRVNLGYDGLFGPKTMFYHIPSALEEGESLLRKLNVPVLGSSDAFGVQIGTLLAIVLGFGWVFWQLLRATVRHEKNSKRSKSD